jgi:hypothetical protein
MNGSRRKQYEELTPGQRAAVDAFRARQATPEARDALNAVRSAVRQEFPPAIADPATMEMLAALRLERQRLGLSLTDVSEASNLDRSMIAKLETGKIPNPTLGTLRRYAAALGKELSFGLVDARR